MSGAFSTSQLANFCRPRGEFEQRPLLCNFGKCVDMLPAIELEVRRHEYPDPPSVYYRRLECTGFYVPDGPGVYFVLDEQLMRMKYVGCAKSLKKRLRGHSKVDCEDFVAWLEFSSDRLEIAESYYIGLLSPYANFGGQA